MKLITLNAFVKYRLELHDIARLILKSQIKKGITETCDSERVNYLKNLLFYVSVPFSSTWTLHSPAIWVENFFKQSTRFLSHVYGTPFFSVDLASPGCLSFRLFLISDLLTFLRSRVFFFYVDLSCPEYLGLRLFYIIDLLLSHVCVTPFCVELASPGYLGFSSF